jgi:riboflavin synthase
MFTGIVEEIGSVADISATGLSIQASLVMDDLRVSDSISVNGACLTVTGVEGPTFSVDTVPETLRRTNLGSLETGHHVNLERSMAADGRFGGHIVQGHVDGVGKVLSIEPEGEARNIKFEANDSIMRYVVEKGFVAVDGISLTVVDCDERSFRVTLIPYTRENTAMRARREGDRVNIEVDIMAKYVEKLSASQ